MVRATLCRAVFAALIGSAAQADDVPRLVLQITVDQLRGDLIDRFGAGFGEGGFEYLLENAVRFHGGGPDQKPEIHISIKEDSGNVNISVFDNGQGISQEAINRIFDMFTVATDKTNGYGLGLYLVKKAIQKLNGTIQVKSEEHEFTQFEISLPKSTS